MTGPTPVAGRNPYTLGYQVSQYGSDTAPAAVVPSFTVLDHLASPPASGITAEASPGIVFSEDTNPPPGAGDNEPADVNPMIDPLYPDQTGGYDPSNP